MSQTLEEMIKEIVAKAQPTTSDSPKMSRHTVQRLPQIKEGMLAGFTQDQIAKKLGVNEKTIDRDIAAWLHSGEFEEWIKAEWVRLHDTIVKKQPLEAYRNLTKLVGNMLTRRIEAKTEITERTVNLNVTEDEDEILSRAAAILDKKLPRQAEPERIH